MSFRLRVGVLTSMLLSAAMAGLVIGLAVWPALAAEEPSKKVAEQPEKKGAEGQEQKAEEPPAEAPDPYAVPDGTSAELAEFIERVLRTRPKNMEQRTKAIEAMRKAADKILSGKATDEELKIAVQTETMFAGDVSELEALAAKLKKADKPKLARQVDGALLRRKLLAAARDPGDELKKLMGEVEKHLSEAPLQSNDVSLAMTAGQVAEQSDDKDLAVETYTSLGKILAASDDETIAARGKTMEGVVRRLTVIGKPMQVEGTILGGEKFDWSKYQGKVVLVDFWASWCPPCVREVPNMKKEYEKYHDKGFEIVGISLDRSREDLERFVKEKEIPWTILYSDEARSPSIAHYGVMAIPTMMLVGKDGKVLSTTARGEELIEELEKLFPAAKEEEAKDEKAKDEKEASKE